MTGTRVSWDNLTRFSNSCFFIKHIPLGHWFTHLAIFIKGSQFAFQMAGITAESWHSYSIVTGESWLSSVVLLPVCSKDEWYCWLAWGDESKHLENMSLSLTSLSNCWHAESTFQTSLDSRYLNTWLNQICFWKNYTVKGPSIKMWVALGILIHQCHWHCWINLVLRYLSEFEVIWKTL